MIFVLIEAAAALLKRLFSANFQKQAWSYASVILLALTLPYPVHALSVGDSSNPTDSNSGPIQFAVWPQLAPGETTLNQGHLGDTSGNTARITDITCPQLLVFPSTKAALGPAVLICPGGGYGVVSSDLEGTELAHWLNHLGYTAAVLYYRVPNNRDGALQDGQRALSFLRARAKEFSIDPTRLGLMGFSAGGHLSARLAVAGNKRAYRPIDDIDRQNCRPDFALLIYPAYLLYNAGDGLAPETRPVAGMPPLFLAQTLDDPFFTVLPYAHALIDKGIAVQSCVYTTGGHGYGLRLKADVPGSKWSSDAAQWLLKNFPPPGGASN